MNKHDPHWIQKITHKPHAYIFIRELYSESFISVGQSRASTNPAWNVSSRFPAEISGEYPQIFMDINSINVKTLQFNHVLTATCIDLHIENSKNDKKVILATITSTKCQCAAE